MKRVLGRAEKFFPSEKKYLNTKGMLFHFGERNLFEEPFQIFT